MPEKQTRCWWCDEPARRVPLVVRYGTWFHRGRCVIAFESNGHAVTVRTPKQKYSRRRVGEELAPRRDRRLAKLLEEIGS